MRRALIFFSIPILFSGSVLSGETEIDDDFMRTVEDTNTSLANNIALKDAPSSTADAKQLESMFEKVEVFYSHKGDANDAVTLSKKSKDLSVDILKLVSARDFDTATVKATDLARACKSCHNFYKKS